MLFEVLLNHLWPPRRPSNPLRTTESHDSPANRIIVVCDENAHDRLVRSSAAEPIPQPSMTAVYSPIRTAEST